MEKVDEIEPNKTAFYQRKAFLVILNFLLILIIISSTIGRDLYLKQPPNLISFAITHFAGYLFFLIMPVELIFMYFVTEQHNVFILILVAISTALSAQLVDYFFGKQVSQRFLKRLINPRRYTRARNFLLRYGSITIFVFNLFPLSSPIIILAAGMLRYPLRPVLLYSFLGLLLKYAAISLFFV